MPISWQKHGRRRKQRWDSKIPDVVATSVLWYARRKCELAEQPESYLPLLYETELTDYYMRLAINLKGEKQREQRMREARNSAVPGIDI